MDEQGLAKQELNRALQMLNRSGHDFSFDLPDHLDGNGFYRIISKYLCNDGSHPKSARKKICNLQDKCHCVYYVSHPFTSSSEIMDFTPKNLFKITLSESRKNFKPPTPRDVQASSELLKRTIALHLYTKQENVVLEVFKPEKHSDGEPPIHVLASENNGTCVELSISDEDRVNFQLTNNHEMCFWKRYRGTFEGRRDCFYKKGLHLTRSEQQLPELWRVVPIKNRDFTFFRCVSLAIYGDENMYKYIIELVIEQENDENLIDAFSQFLDPEHATEKKQQQQALKTHLDKLKTEGNPKEGDIYAVATFLQTSIYIASRNEIDKVEWRMFHPLPSSNQALSNSYLSLFRRIKDNKDQYVLLTPEEDRCTCLEKAPEVNGQLTFFMNLESEAASLLERREVCCSSGARKPHIHLLEDESDMENSGDRFRPLEVVHKEYPDEDNISSTLKAEKRKLDPTPGGQGTFEQCMNKELHSFQGYNDSEQFQVPSDDDIRKKATEIRVPIFILHSDCKWRVYTPDKIRPAKSMENEKCKYYVTLLFNEDKNYFARIIPDNGCNCKKMPPQTSKPTWKETVQNASLLKSFRHVPMVEYFEDATSDDMETDEERCEYEFEDFDEIEEVMQREDMKDRQIDAVRSSCESFWACISKEIFGTETHAGFVQSYICKEITSNPKIYKPLMLKWFKTKEQFLEILSKNIVVMDDVYILATATFFQTPIYILEIETDGSSKWSEYSQIRRKPRPTNFPTRISKCRRLNQHEKYYVSLLRTPIGNYLRIVPKRGDCNCTLEVPTFPAKMEGKLCPLVINDSDFKTIYRNLRKATKKSKSSLDAWVAVCDQLTKEFVNIINTCVGHRKNVNTAVVVGAGTGLVGGGLMITGLALAPVTAGISTALTIAGGVLGFIGGTTSAGSKVTEGVITKIKLDEINLLEMALEVISNTLKHDTEELQKAFNEMKNVISLFEDEDFAVDHGMSSTAVPALARSILSFHFIPVLVLRLSFRTASIALGAAAAAAAVILDLAFLVHAIKNMVTGNKTMLTDELEKKINELSLTKMRLLTWAYGNRGTGQQ